MERTKSSKDYGSQHASRDTVVTGDPGDLGDPPPTVIDNFRGEYHFLSNFFPSPISQDGLVYPTVEHAFQAAKSFDKADKLSILASNGPTAAKRNGRHIPLRSDWERVKMDIMHDILALKYAPGSKLGDLLLATGNAQIIEGNNWHDNVWGSCNCAKHSATPGKNHLGKLIMRVREELRSGKLADSNTSS